MSGEQRTMPDPNNQDSDKFVEVDGAKFKEDPETPGEALKGEDGNPIPFEEAPADPKVDKPTFRRSKQDHIIDRKNRKIDKLEQAKKGEKDDDEDDDDDEDLTPESKAAIKKGIAKELKPIKEGLQQSAENRAKLADDDELKAAIAKFPKAKGMEDSVKQYMEAYPNAPVEFIIQSLLGKQKAMEEAAVEADDKEKKNRLGGNSRRAGKGGRATGDIPDANSMSKKDWDALERDVMLGKYLPNDFIRD